VSKDFLKPSDCTYELFWKKIDNEKGEKKYQGHLNKRDSEEAEELTDEQSKMFAKAFEAGFETNIAFLVAYSVGGNRISRGEVYDLAVGRLVK